MSHSLNDDEVNMELKKMVEFIRQEAQEKAREIQVKADEEFAIEKAKIVQQESASLDAQFEKKKKHVESNQSNKARLQVLKLREEQLEGLFDKTRQKLTKLTNDKPKYKKLLEDLLLQGLLDLTEPYVDVLARSGDVQTVQEVAESAVKRYKDATGRTTKVNVQDGLDKDSAGGLILAGHGGRIRLNNTLEERLHILESEMLPELRLDLFGPNPHRK